MTTNYNLKKKIIELATIWWKGDFEIDDDTDITKELRQSIKKLFELEPDIRQALRDMDQYTVCGIKRYLSRQVKEQ